MSDLTRYKLRKAPAESPDCRHSSKPLLISESPVPTKKHRSNSKTRSSRGSDLQLSRQREALSSRLKELTQNKQWEAQQCRARREALLAEMHEHSDQLQHLYALHQAKAGTAVSQQQVDESTHQARLAAYADSASSLETQLAELHTQQAHTAVALAQAQEVLAARENALRLLNEELHSRSVHRAEYIAQREECEELLEHLKCSHPDCFEDSDAEDSVVRRELLSLKQAREAKVAAVHQLDSQLSQLHAESAQLREALRLQKEASISAIHASPTKKAAEDIDKLEAYFTLKAEEAGVASLQEVVAELNSAAGFDLDEAVLRKQLELVTQQEHALTAGWSLFEKSMNNKLKLATAQDNWDDMEQFEDELMDSHRVYSNRVAAITQWKKDVCEVLGPARPVSVTADRRVLEEFKQSFLSSGQRGKIEEMLGVYMQKLQQREQSLANQDSQFSQHKASVKSVAERLEELQSQKQHVELQKNRLRKELMKAIIEEKNLVRRLRTSVGEPDSPVLEEAAILQENIQYWERLIQLQNESIDGSLSRAKEALLQELQSLKQNQHSLVAEQTELEHELTAFASQLDKLRLCQREEMLVSIETSTLGGQHQISQLERSIKSTQHKLNKAEQELKLLDAQHTAVMENFDKEESLLRQQHLELRASQEGRATVSRSAKGPALLGDSSRRGQEPYYPLEIRERAASSLFDKNPYYEVVEKVLNKQVPEPAVYKKYYRLNLEDTTQHEKYFYEKVMPLLEGAQLYKKNKAVKGPPFDPLNAARKAPEAYGYAVKHFRLHKSLARIDIKHPLKPGFEASLQIDLVVAPMIPQRTMSILKHQKKLVQTDLDVPRHLDPAEDSASESLKEKCRQCALYPFSIVLDQGSPMEVIAKDYLTFKQWVNGLNALVKYKKYLGRLKTRIESYTTV